MVGVEAARPGGRLQEGKGLGKGGTPFPTTEEGGGRKEEKGVGTRFGTWFRTFPGFGTRDRARRGRAPWDWTEKKKLCYSGTP